MDNDKIRMHASILIVLERLRSQQHTINFKPAEGATP